MSEVIAKRETIAAMVDAYKAAVAEVKEGYKLLGQAKIRLCGVVGGDGYAFDTLPDGCRNSFKPLEDVLDGLKRKMWSVLIDRMELRKFMSSKRLEEFNHLLYNQGRGAELPEIEETVVVGMLQGAVDDLPRYIEEAAKEVFDWLRPRHDRYKTNSQYEIGDRAIVYVFSPDKWVTSARIDYHYHQRMRNLDNIFHLLDGKGPIDTHQGPLVNAFIQQNVPFGEERETEYFKVRIHKNGNAHIAFKRLDIVAKLNAMCGGFTLKHDVEATKNAA